MNPWEHGSEHAYPVVSKTDPEPLELRARLRTVPSPMFGLHEVVQWQLERVGLGMPNTPGRFLAPGRKPRLLKVVKLYREGYYVSEEEARSACNLYVATILLRGRYISR